MRKKLFRSRENRKICGVCGGIADCLNIDATIVRLAVIAITIITPCIGDGILIYLLASIILPAEKKNKVSE